MAEKFREIHVLGILVGGYKHEVTTFLLPLHGTVCILFNVQCIYNTFQIQPYGVKYENADEANHQPHASRSRFTETSIFMVFRLSFRSIHIYISNR